MTIPIETALALLEREVQGYQVPVVDLIAAQTSDPFRVLVATILSSRTKDEVTATACRRLFARADTPESLARLGVAELEELIYPVGFYRNKARHLSLLPGILAERFAGQVPGEIEDLLTLPGVGRKTANLVRAVAFRKPAICVDTHVHRIMNIWGYVTTRTPLETEMALREKLPARFWLSVNGLLVAFGQAICKPQRPWCDQCPLEQLCPKIGVSPRTPKSNPPQAHPMDKLLVSWNVNGIRAALKNGLLEVFDQLNADLYALQEIKVQPSQLPEELRQVDGYDIYWNPAIKKGYAGTAVFTRHAPQNVSYGLNIPELDEEGRVLTLEFADFFLVNIYSPNAQPELKRLEFKERFNKALLAYLEQLRARKSVVACGDLNVAHKEIDLANPKANIHNPGFSAAERAWMDQVTAAGYIDTFRSFDTSPGRYTWWSYRFNARAKNIGWRIDYFLVDQGSAQRVRGAAIHEEITGSDHCPVSLLFR